MKRFKTLISYTLYTLSVAVAFTSCSDDRQKINRGDYSKNGVSRINVVETTVINRHRLSIIKVDQKEFFVNADGGIVPLSNCN